MPVDEESIKVSVNSNSDHPTLDATINSRAQCPYVFSACGLLLDTDYLGVNKKHYCDYCDVFLTHDSTSGQ
jgi:hypothetical protein